MISALLFDFGGTLDADGEHWLDRFYAIYHNIGLPEISKTRIKEAFYWADAQAEKDPGMRTAGLRDMMDRHTVWQFKKLGVKSPTLAALASSAFTKPADRILRRNRKTLETLSLEGLKLGIISNFYGNIETLCREYAFSPFLSVILDSAMVGLRKPDPKIFALAAERLRLPYAQIGFVGDSYERDIIPAKALGMQTFWLIGDKDIVPPDASKVDRVMRSLADLPHELGLKKKVKK